MRQAYHLRLFCRLYTKSYLIKNHWGSLKSNNYWNKNCSWIPWLRSRSINRSVVDILYLINSYSVVDCWCCCYVRKGHIFHDNDARSEILKLTVLQQVSSSFSTAFLPDFQKIVFSFLICRIVFSFFQILIEKNAIIPPIITQPKMPRIACHELQICISS